VTDYNQAIEERLQYLAGLPSGWGNCMGLPIKPQAIENTRIVIRAVTAAAGGNLPMPYIGLCGDGTLSVQWNMPDGSELIVDVPLADRRVGILWLRTDVLGDINCEMSALGRVIKPLLGRET